VSLIIVVRDEDADRVIRAVNVVCPWCEAVRLPANADIAEIAEFYGYESDGDGGLREIKRNLRSNERDLRIERAQRAEDEIDRLRAALRTIARIPSTDPAAYKRIALNALKEEATADGQ
jgi:hypothetical protein